MISETVRQAFRDQADVCAKMGSPFMGELCHLIAENLDESTPVGKLCLNWSGNPVSSADNVPLRLCGGLHALVLTGQAAKLSEFYPAPNGGGPDWILVQNVLKKHSDFLVEWMESPPQTNEVSRSAVLWPSFMEISKLAGKPLCLLELGASAGLNLNADHYSYRLGGIPCGADGSSLLLEPEWQGNKCVVTEVDIKSKLACDLNPLDTQNSNDALSLRAYVWPDQQARMDRLNAALSIADKHPIQVDRADAVAWLEANLQNLPIDQCTVIYSTVAWQYFPDALKTAGEELIVGAARRATTDSPLAWLQFEADGETPGGNIGLRVWPYEVDSSLGRADFHGRWVDWKGL